MQNINVVARAVVTNKAVLRLGQTQLNVQVELEEPRGLIVEVRNVKTTHSLVSFDVWDSVGKIRGFVNVDTHGDSNPVKFGV